MTSSAPGSELTAPSLAVAVRLWLPAASGTEAICHAPVVPLAVVLPSTVAPSRRVTRTPGSATPAKPGATMPVTRSVVEGPLSEPGASARVGTASTGSARSKTTAALLPALSARSLPRATRLWLPSPTRVTLVDQTPPTPTVAVAIGLTPALSKISTALPGLASVRVPLMVRLAENTVPPAWSMASVGAVVSTFTTRATEPLEVFSDALVAVAVKRCVPSASRPVSMLQAPVVASDWTCPTSSAPSFSVTRTSGAARPVMVSVVVDVTLSVSEAPLSCRAEMSRPVGASEAMLSGNRNRFAGSEPAVETLSRSASRWVPATVPSVTHNSTPWSASKALKTAVPLPSAVIP